MSNTFVWVDIPVLDLDRAIAFYSAVTASPVGRQGGPGFSFGLFRHEGDEVGGCLVPAGNASQPSLHGPLVYLGVGGRLDAAVDAALQAGGKVIQAKHAIGPNGWRAVVADTEGNRVALHSMTE
jgi:predicted enzyme related to lactoylglutathione lyase